MNALIMAHAKIVGYIRLMRRLYQLSNLPFRPKKMVKPEQKKNSASPIAPLLPMLYHMDTIYPCGYL